MFVKSAPFLKVTKDLPAPYGQHLMVLKLLKKMSEFVIMTVHDDIAPHGRQRAQ